MNLTHTPVLLTETIDALAIKPDGIYVDGTFGRGGHARAILSHLSDKGQLWVMDQDPAAILEAEKLAAQDARVKVRHDSFVNLKDWLEGDQLLGKVDGILLDLGVSSPQLDDPVRGFSFLKLGPLDMRMNTAAGLTAGEWLNQVSERELADVIYQYGEERFAKRIARAIVATRRETPLETTIQLAELIKATIPFREKHKHPATRTFQAIRIFINQELESLKLFLVGALDCLKPGGRLVIISFHSLEDRLVKQFFKKEARGDAFPLRLAVKQDMLQPRLKIIGRAVFETEEAIIKNPRSRSAVLRLAEKI